MPKRTHRYEDSLAEDLRDPAAAAAYLNAALEELETEDGPALFLMALGDVMRANGATHVAKQAKLGRESLYKALSPSGNPKLTSVVAILGTLGLQISVKATRRPTHGRASSHSRKLAKAS